MAAESGEEKACGEINQPNAAEGGNGHQLRTDGDNENG